MVRADSGIRSLEDLRGRRVVVGQEGTVTAMTVEGLLRALGLWDDIVKVRHGVVEGLYELRMGYVDAVVVIDAVPSPLVYEAAAVLGLRIVPIPAEALERVREAGLVFFKPGVVPAGSYPGVDEDVETLAIETLAVTTADAPEALVKAVIDFVLSGAIEIDTSRVAVMPVPITIHPVAHSYYFEKGVAVVVTP